MGGKILLVFMQASTTWCLSSFCYVSVLLERGVCRLPRQAMYSIFLNSYKINIE